MIITAVKAQNVLKYAELELENLPEKGIIAVSGNNESGKSSIGETVCFALFGRTFSLNPEELEKIIRWGEENCSVTLTFKVEEQEYSLYRYLDKNGNHSAWLSVLGHEDAPLARGSQEVAIAIANILGYEFEEFIESFYLAQREITSPHPHSFAVKTMAGVGALERVSMGYEQDILQQKETLEELQTENESLQDELEELAFEEGYLITLEDDTNKLEADLENTRERVVDLNASSDTYIANEGHIRKAAGKKGRARFWSLLNLLLALVAGGAWALITQKSELAQSVKLLDMLQQSIPDWQDSYINYIGITGMVFAVLFLFFWIRSASHSARVKALHRESAELAKVMANVQSVAEYEVVAETHDTSDDEDQEPVTHLPAPAMRYDVRKYAILLPKVESAKAAGSDVARYTEIEQQWLAEQITLREERFSQMCEEVDAELARAPQAAHLQEVISSLQSKSEELSSKLGVREKAIELLAGASKHFSSKFNRDIRDLMSSTLPLFTQGRYEYLQVEPDLGVRIFSSDKRDFLDLEEISSGTQRQIMLALRLAMSQKLMGRAVKGRQFAFLDEPFAFFDEERTKYALLALDELSDALSQIWIVSQTFPDGHEFAAEVKCSRDIASLSFTAS
jgi:exonuclease SbcC